MTLPFSSLLPCILSAAASVSLRLLWADLSGMSEHNFSEFSWCNLDGVFCLIVSLRFEHPANVFGSNLLRFSDNNWSFEHSSTNFLLWRSTWEYNYNSTCINRQRNFTTFLCSSLQNSLLGNLGCKGHPILMRIDYSSLCWYISIALLHIVLHEHVQSASLILTKYEFFKFAL